MKLATWTYEGPPHVGAMRVAASMEGLHYVLHAPQGDTYADLLFTMIGRDRKRPPVTYTTFQARDLGADTAAIFKTACAEAVERFAPEALIVGASCTAELLQDDPGGLSKALALDLPVVPLELPSYQKKENWGAAETFYRLARAFVRPVERTPGPPRVNLLGLTSLGFRSRDDLVEVRRILDALGVAVNVCAPLGARPADLARLTDADLNLVLAPEIADPTARWLEKAHGMPMVRTVPIGVGATGDFIAEVAGALGVDPAPALALGERLSWYSRSIDSNYLTGKRAFVFGDATHALALARVARDELGFEVCGLGSYDRTYARELRAAARDYGVEATITDDQLEVEAAIAAAAPEIVLGTQMERHVAKRMRLPCAVISAPFHVQDVPARHSPQMGFEGANVLFDTLVHPLMMGLEEHLLGMFREDFEFNDAAHASHLAAVEPAPAAAPSAEAAPSTLSWASEAERELRKIPFFVRGKARRNTEAFAAERGLATITLETLYDAKAHYAR